MYDKTLYIIIIIIDPWSWSVGPKQHKIKIGMALGAHRGVRNTGHIPLPHLSPVVTYLQLVPHILSIQKIMHAYTLYKYYMQCPPPSSPASTPARGIQCMCIG